MFTCGLLRSNFSFAMTALRVATFVVQTHALRRFARAG
jgi:hypothetical protein